MKGNKSKLDHKIIWHGWGYFTMQMKICWRNDFCYFCTCFENQINSNRIDTVSTFFPILTTNFFWEPFHTYLEWLRLILMWIRICRPILECIRCKMLSRIQTFKNWTVRFDLSRIETGAIWSTDISLTIKIPWLKNWLLIEF